MFQSILLDRAPTRNHGGGFIMEHSAEAKAYQRILDRRAKRFFFILLGLAGVFLIIVLIFGGK